MHPEARAETTMLRITTEKKKAKTILSVEGRLAGVFVPTLEQCWRELKAATPQEKFYIDLCGVSFIDGAGKMLLKEMHRQGVQLMAQGCLNQAIVEEIIGSDKLALKSSEKGNGKNGDGKDGGKGAPIAFYLALLSLLFSPGGLRAQESPSAQTMPANTAESGQAQKLTLESAVRLALKQNPTAQIAVLDAAQAVEDKNVARAALVPQADLVTSDSV